MLFHVKRLNLLLDIFTNCYYICFVKVKPFLLGMCYMLAEMELFSSSIVNDGILYVPLDELLVLFVVIIGSCVFEVFCGIAFIRGSFCIIQSLVKRFIWPGRKSSAPADENKK